VAEPHGPPRAALALVLLALLAQGCARWPEHGSGGLAEIRPLAQSPCARCGGHPDPTWESLDMELQIVRGHLDNLVLAGAEACLPAHVAVAREREARIARALNGGLPLDAANDLIIQRHKLAELERRLGYIQSQGVCRPGAVMTGAPVGAP
jgi:hypothetical protein